MPVFGFRLRGPAAESKEPKELVPVAVYFVIKKPLKLVAPSQICRLDIQRAAEEEVEDKDNSGKKPGTGAEEDGEEEVEDTTNSGKEPGAETDREQDQAEVSIFSQRLLIGPLI